MRTHSWLSLGSIAFLAMAAVASVAQEAPPTQDPKNEEQTPEDKPVVPKWHQLTISYNSIKDHLRLNQYGRPVSGFSIDELRLFSPGSPTSPFAKLNFRGFPNRDSALEGVVALNSGHTILRGNRRENEFYDQSWFPKSASKDRVTEVSVDHSLNPNAGGFLAYRSDERDQNYSAPRDRERTRTQLFAGGVQGRVFGTSNVGVTAAERRTATDTGAQPTTIQRRFDAHYEHQFGESLSLEGSAGYSRIEQAGQASSSIRTYSLAGALDLGPATSVQFNFGLQELDLNSILNAYVRKRTTSGARLIHRWPNWSFQAGFRHRESERVRTDQTFVDVPKQNEYDARLSGRIGDIARLTLRGTWEDLRATAIMNTSDQRQLLWDDRAMFQAKLDGGGELFSAYGTYTYRFQQNRQRGVEIGWHNFAIGGSYVFSPLISGFAEFSSDSFRVIGQAETGEELGTYFPESRSVSAGLSWSRDPSLGMTASINHYNSSDVRGTQLTISLRNRIAPDHELEFVVAPWRHEDRLYNVSGYRTTFASLRYTVKF